MNYIAETGAAALFTGYLVAMFKLAVPDAKPWILVLVSICSGILGSVLVALSTGAVVDTQLGAQWVIQGVIAAAGAAGLTRTDGRAQEVREKALGES